MPSVNPLGLILPVVRTEARARKESNNANLQEVMNFLMRKKWFINIEQDISKNIQGVKEIWIESGKVLNKLNINREGLSSDYPKLPTFIMIECIKKFNAYYFREDYLDKYKIATTKDENLQAMFDNFKPQAIELLEKNMSGQEKRFVDKKIQDGSQELEHEFEGTAIHMPYIDIKGNEQLREIMYNKYLHWCSEMDSDLAALIVQVNIAHIDIRTNRFYRNVVEG